MNKIIPAICSLFLLCQNAPAVLAQQTSADVSQPQSVQEYRDRARLDGRSHENITLSVKDFINTAGIAAGAAAGPKRLKNLALSQKRAQQEVQKNLQNSLEEIIKQPTEKYAQQTTRPLQKNKAAAETAPQSFKSLSQRAAEATQKSAVNATAALPAHSFNRAAIEAAKAGFPDPYIMLLINRPQTDLDLLLPLMLKEDFPELTSKEIAKVAESFKHAARMMPSNHAMARSLIHTAADHSPFSPIGAALRALSDRILLSKMLPLVTVAAGGALIAAQAQNTLSQKMQRLWENPQLLLVMSDEDAELFEQNQEAKNMVITISNAYRALSEMTPQEQGLFSKTAPNNRRHISVQGR